MITCNLNVIPDARVRNIVSIDFTLILISVNVVERSLFLVNDFSNRRCKQENVEPDALKEWKNILKIF